MPLQQPKLDDKTFDVLVAEAIKLIPRESSEWTDHNRHDPGITLVELFAWLAEMQQYYLNSIGPASYLKFLRLLGTKPRSVTPARTEINFHFSAKALAPEIKTADPILVPRGTKLTNSKLGAEQALVFETSSPLLVLPIALRKVITSNRRGLKDNTDANSWDGLSYFAFGEEAETDSRLYLGFDKPFPNDATIALTLNLFDDYLVPRATHDDEHDLPLPSARVVWEYADSTGEWAPLDIVATISAALDNLTRGQTGADCLSWIGPLRATVSASKQYQSLPPDARESIDKALTDANSQQDVVNLLANPDFLLARGDGTLMFSQRGRFFFASPADMQARVVHPFNEDELFWLRATVRKQGYELPPRIDSIGLNTVGAEQLDTISEVTEFAVDKTNTPLEAMSYLALYGSTIVQVRERDGRWRDWLSVSKRILDSSGPNDNHYVLEREHRDRAHPVPQKVSITFGDGKHGRIPPQGDDQIRLIAYLPEFSEPSMLGRSNGLPQQTFPLDRDSVVGEKLAIQVLERIELPPTSTEAMDLSCLLRLQRTTKTRVQANETFTVQLTIEARQQLCEVEVHENLSGDVRFSSAKSLAGEMMLVKMDEHELVIRTGKLPAHSKRTLTYTLTSGAAGGSIRGTVSVSPSLNCPSESQPAPVSLVEIGTGLADSRWRDWIRVDDFDSSGPNDPHFVFDATMGVVTFGDGINGDIPQAAADPPAPDDKNIRIISLQTCFGAAANVPKEAIGAFARPWEVTLPQTLLDLERSPLIAAAGGEAGETITDAQVRARKDLQTQYTAVTSADFELLAIHTPGLRVARAKAIPRFSVAHPDHAEASVTVVVLPYSLLPKPVPSENFRRTVCRHLNRHRSVTTQVEVVAPNYVRVSVQATVLLESGFDIEDSRAAIVRDLERFLRPVPAEDDTENTGWPFGRTVYKSEIYQLIEKVTGVDCVENVFLSAEGIDARRDENGNITINPLSVVFSGDQQVEVVTPSGECRRARG